MSIIQARLRDKEEEMDHARSLLDIAIEDAHNHAREAEEATSEARELRAALEENTEALSAREAATKGAEEAVKVSHIYTETTLRLCFLLNSSNTPPDGSHPRTRPKPMPKTHAVVAVHRNDLFFPILFT